MIFNKFALACVTTATLLAGAAQAATVTIATENGTAMETEFGVRADTGSRGPDLAGAMVTASFEDGTTESAVWAAFDPFNEGGVNGDRWSLFLGTNDVVDVVADGRIMTRLVFDLSTSQSITGDPTIPPGVVRNGAAVFDISAEDEGAGDTGSTVGSAFGYPFSFVVNEPVGDVAVTYSGAVNLVGAAAVGDLFTTMTVDFSGLVAGGLTGSVSYTTDFDVLAVAGDLRPTTMAAVPLPAGLPLLLAGLGGLGLLRRNRKG